MPGTAYCLPSPKDCVLHDGGGMVLATRQRAARHTTEVLATRKRVACYTTADCVDICVARPVYHLAADCVLYDGYYTMKGCAFVPPVRRRKTAFYTTESRVPRQGLRIRYRLSCGIACRLHLAARCCILQDEGLHTEACALHEGWLRDRCRVPHVLI
ncbi:hypothetical protein GN244_ATG12016 [Phytophthora infestans]|uniref:Uncharacterized protein n=1 Tax=Phytophthora infestans TaxID=4787 RepID=A0A833SKJ6_PHYIN|nr:hypothetical protein GN244_ATG12016 [Phytophthora infestans]KAF4138089.1 hypothetical protein GN958_ATG12698 [Phytophthora infestans]